MTFRERYRTMLRVSKIMSSKKGSPENGIVVHWEGILPLETVTWTFIPKEDEPKQPNFQARP